MYNLLSKRNIHISPSLMFALIQESYFPLVTYPFWNLFLQWHSFSGRAGGCPSYQSLHFPNFPHRINPSVPWVYTCTPGSLVAWTQGQLWYCNCAMLQRSAQLPKNCESPRSGPFTFSLLSGCVFQLGSWSISELHCSYTIAEPYPLLIQTLNVNQKCDCLVWRHISSIIMDLLTVTWLWLSLVTTTRPETLFSCGIPLLASHSNFPHHCGLVWSSGFLTNLSCHPWACPAPFAGACWDMLHSSYSLIKSFSWESLKYLWAEKLINANCWVSWRSSLDNSPVIQVSSPMMLSQESKTYLSKGKCSSYCQNNYYCTCESAPCC